VPMLLGGDERGRTQRGNNNAWCHDNELSWFDWRDDEDAEQLRDFTRRLIRLRRDHPVFRRTRFLEGRDLSGSGVPDAWWFRPDGRRMTQRDWRQDDGHMLGVFLDGSGLLGVGAHGERLHDESFLLLFNASSRATVFVLPPRRFGRRWALELSTAEPDAGGTPFPARGLVPLEDRSVVVLRRSE
jgi:isoamylase